MCILLIVGAFLVGAAIGPWALPWLVERFDQWRNG